jgi:DNA repair protein RadC
MDLKTIARYVNYNFVAQAIMSALGGTRSRNTDQRFGQFGSITMQKIGALPVGLKFKLNGVKFSVGFTYDLNGNILLDLFCPDDGQSGLFDLTKKIYADRARDFLIIHAQLPFDDKVNRKNAQQIINEIAKEVKKANPAAKKQKPRVKPPVDDGGERAPGELTPEAIAILHSNPRDRKKILKKKPTPPTPPVKKPDPENINILSPGRPNKIQRMNNRGFDVVEKRSITYTKKSPGKKLSGIADRLRAKDKRTKHKLQRIYTKYDDRGLVGIYIDINKINQKTEPATYTIAGKKYQIREDRDGAYYIYFANASRKSGEINVPQVAYLFDYTTGAQITELYFDNMINGTRAAAKTAKVGAKSYSATGKKKPSPKQILARAKFAEMVRERAAAKKVNGLYKQRPERIITGVNDKNWWAGFGKVPASGKVNFILMPTERAAKKIEALTMMSYVPRIKISVTRGKQFEKLPQVTSGDAAARAIRRFFTATQLETQEYGGAIFLDKQNKVLGCYVGFIGGIDSAVVDPRLVYGAALEVGATGLILFHNHPSGSLRSSEPDKRMTADFKAIGRTMQIMLLDHIILTARGYFSMAENGEI